MLNFNTAQEVAYGSIPASAVSVDERLAFLKKVYTLLAASLGTAAVGAFLGTGPLLPVVAPNLMLFFVLEIGLIFFANFAQRKPGLNMIALFSFTTVSGLTLGPLLYRVGPMVATQAFALTALTFVGLTLYVIFSKKDFSFMSGFLMVGLITVVIGGLLNIFLFQSPMLHFAMSGIGVFLFSGFILYDTSNIMRHYSTEDYIPATLALYLDILNLFTSLLSLLGLANND
jgi:FtsH-binding integral membrane protein